MEVQIRPAAGVDVAGICNVEIASCGNTLGEEIIRTIVRSRESLRYVAIHSKVVVGFAFAERDTDRRYVVLNVVVHPKWRRFGIGSGLAESLQQGIKSLQQVHATRLVVYARETSLPSHLFLKHNGFRAVTFVRDWFMFNAVGEVDGNMEDAIKFVWWYGDEGKMTGDKM
mgnify:FL=1